MLPFTVLPHMSTAEDENELPDSLATFKTFGFKKEMTEEAHRAHKLERRVRLHAGYVYRQGVDDDRSIYFVRDGVIELCQENNQGGSVRLGKGDCFGQMCLAWLKEPSECLRMHSARAITECSLYLLNRSALLELEENCPLAMERLKPICLHEKERRVARATRMVRRYGDLTIDEDGDADRVDITKASEQRMANLVSQQVVAALAGGSGAGVPGISPTPSPFARSPGRKDKGADWSNSKQLVSSIIPPRRLPAIDGDSSTRVDALEEKVDKLTIEIGGIKALLEDLASRSLQP